jgi:hypothetical protein
LNNIKIKNLRGISLGNEEQVFEEVIIIRQQLYMFWKRKNPAQMCGVPGGKIFPCGRENDLLHRHT